MVEEIEKSHAANTGVSWDVAAECCPLLPPGPPLEQELQLFGSKLLRSGPILHKVWTCLLGAYFFLHRQEIGKLVGNT